MVEPFAPKRDIQVGDWTFKSIQLRHYYHPLDKLKERTPDRDDWNTSATVLSSLAYVALPFVISIRADSWAPPDYVFAFAVVFITLGSTWYHLDRRLLDMSGGEPDDADGAVGHTIDSVAMDFFFILLIVTAQTTDPGYWSLVGWPILAIVVHVAIVMVPGLVDKGRQVIGGGESENEKVARYAIGLIDVVLTGVVLWSIYLGVDEDRFDKGWSIAAVVIYAVAWAAWIGRQHAYWHVLSALAIALVWRGTQP